MTDITKVEKEAESKHGDKRLVGKSGSSKTG